MFAFELTVVLLMLGANALFAAYEMALASVSRARLVALAGQRAAGAEAAVHMKERMEASLAVVQLGITLAGSVAAAVGGAGAEETVAPFLEAVAGFSPAWADIAAIACVVVPLGACTVIFAELVPKTFAIGNNEWVCLKLSPAMRVLAALAGPVVSVVERLVKGVVGSARWSRHADGLGAGHAGLHELNAAATLARSARLIGAREERIVLSAAQLAQRRISEIMLSPRDISMVPLEASLMDALVRAHLDLHTRFPVCAKDGDPQTIAGYVNFKDIVVALKMSPGTEGVRGIMRAIKRVESSASMAQALEEMLRDHVHIALVAAKEGRVLGLITLQDILKELVGHVGDEFDELPRHINQAGNGWVIGGGASLTTVAAVTGLALGANGRPQRPGTLAEWFSLEIGRPKGGDVVGAEGIVAVVRKLRRRRVAEAFLAAASVREGR
ncbi:MAG: DUF21 domain-containing protein [Elusimicrobia bacterium]|nr:DUF21 domain-containing protein [Elusimicrobiota bacterium]